MQCTESLFYVVALGSQALDESGPVNYGTAGLHWGESRAARPSTNRISLLLSHTESKLYFPNVLLVILFSPIDTPWFFVSFHKVPLCYYQHQRQIPEGPPVSH